MCCQIILYKIIDDVELHKRRCAHAVDDNSQPMEVSADPQKDGLQAQLAGIEVGKPETYHGQLKGILSNAALFGTDLCAAGLCEKIEAMFVDMLAGKDAVRATLKKYLA